MRNWGIVITGFYAAVLILLFTYGVGFLWGVDTEGNFLSKDWEFLNFLDVAWIWILIIVFAQLLLLFLSVDSSWRRVKPRQHVKVTASLVGFLVVVLIVSVVSVIAMAHSGDDGFDFLDNSEGLVIGAVMILIWAFWGVLFYFFSKRTFNVVDLAVSWLIKGSVLELLVAIPCHIIVRQRDECSAPIVTAYGIATGIAIMLLAFGPSVLFLYQRKLGDYRGQSKAPV